jgi:hypothetical protein
MQAPALKNVNCRMDRLAGKRRTVSAADMAASKVGHLRNAGLENTPKAMGSARSRPYGPVLRWHHGSNVPMNSTVTVEFVRASAEERVALTENLRRTRDAHDELRTPAAQPLTSDDIYHNGHTTDGSSGLRSPNLKLTPRVISCRRRCALAIYQGARRVMMDPPRWLPLAEPRSPGGGQGR